MNINVEFKVVYQAGVKIVDNMTCIHTYYLCFKILHGLFSFQCQCLRLFIKKPKFYATQLNFISSSIFDLLKVSFLRSFALLIKITKTSHKYIYKWMK